MPRVGSFKASSVKAFGARVAATLAARSSVEVVLVYYCVSGELATLGVVGLGQDVQAFAVGSYLSGAVESATKPPPKSILLMTVQMVS